MNITGPDASFPQTRWSVLLRLRDSTATDEGEKILAELCQMYWLPLYTFARRSGNSAEDSEDLTQGFFARLVEKDLFTKADPARGRLRSFLLGAFKNYISGESRSANRQKRGGGVIMIPVHELREREVNHDSPDGQPESNPDAAFDRVWFDVLLEHSLNELEAEYRQRGKAEVFKRLQKFLAWNRKDGQLAEAARDLKLSPGAARVAVFRMRERFRELIEKQISETVGNAAEAEEELAHLRRVMGA